MPDEKKASELGGTATGADVVRTDKQTSTPTKSTGGGAAAPTPGPGPAAQFSTDAVKGAEAVPATKENAVFRQTSATDPASAREAIEAGPGGVRGPLSFRSPERRDASEFIVQTNNWFAGSPAEGPFQRGDVVYLTADEAERFAAHVVKA